MSLLVYLGTCRLLEVIASYIGSSLLGREVCSRCDFLFGVSCHLAGSLVQNATGSVYILFLLDTTLQSSPYIFSLWLDPASWNTLELYR